MCAYHSSRWGKPATSAKSSYQRLYAYRHSAIPRSGRHYATRLGASIKRMYEVPASRAPTTNKEGVLRWVYENEHVIQASLQQVRRHLSAGFVRQLPTQSITDNAAHPPFAVPRVQALAAKIKDSAHGPLDMDLISDAVNQFQQHQTLKLCELWALPMFLRIAVLDELSFLVDKVLSSDDEKDLEGVEIDDLLSANIMSLRALETALWRSFVERTSVVESTLQADPAGIYAAMDSKTRDDYRAAIERAARLSGQGELTVARAALNLSLRADQSDAILSHVGYYLRDNNQQQLYAELDCQFSLRARMYAFLQRRFAAPYLALIFAPPMFIGFWITVWLSSRAFPLLPSFIVGFVFFLILLTPAAQIVNRIIANLRPPRTLPKMDYSAGVPVAAKTLLVVPSMLTRRDVIEALLHNLELNYLSAKDSVAHFALLTDYADATDASMPSDAVLLSVATTGIEALNRRYGDSESSPFVLLHRRRLWNAQEKMWMGWERKRGKIEELNSWLRGADDSSMQLFVGDESRVRSCRFVITLDADTRLVPTTARRLIGTLAHPLNRPVRSAGELRRGYSLIQPRVQTEPGSANTTRFSRLFAGDNGIDLYSSAVSDLYQDMFGEGIYAGKGIYDVDSFAESLQGKIPTNLVLSHDLLEGLYARAAMATDISVMEACPSDMYAFLQRAHRWIRGDWQLLSWALGNPRSRSGEQLRFRPGTIGRWKLVDNLRRSLCAPASLALLLAAWTVLPGSAWLWTALILSGGPISISLAIIGQLTRGNWRWGGIRDSVGRVVVAAGRETIRWLHDIAFLPVVAWMTLDAIGRALFRQLVSKRRLLEWMTAEEAGRSARAANFTQALRAFWVAPSVAVVSVVILLFVPSAQLWPAVPVVVLWLSAPLLAWYAGRPLVSTSESRTRTDKPRLRCIARETWRYFEELVGPESNWLPPDNVQYHKRRNIAHRSSPTNIGLYLLASLTAWQLGYHSLSELLTRVENCLHTLSRLKSYRGHLYNWYDIESLQTLAPEYVSTVDSGNLVASLISLRQGILASVSRSRSDDQQRLGLVDTLSAFEEHWLRLRNEGSEDGVVASLRVTKSYLLEHRRPEVWGSDLACVRERHLPNIESAVVAAISNAQNPMSAAGIDNIRSWLNQLNQQLRSVTNEYDAIDAWPTLLRERDVAECGVENSLSMARLQRLAGHSWPLENMHRVTGVADRLLRRVANKCAADDEVMRWIEQCLESLHKSDAAASLMLQRIRRISGQLDVLIDNTDFSFLFDDERKLFHIGFNVSRGELDNSFYDLLASEARIASVVAIAKGDVPVSHWLHLARPITRIGASRVLLSWSGTLFEYLMPSLFMRGDESGLLAQSSVHAIRRQQRFAARKRLPWGISESAYRETDADGIYQYRAFGSADLSLSRHQDARVVVSPYASLLALPFAEQDVYENLDDLERQNAKGRYGFYESLDFGVQRNIRSSTPQVVLAFMAHHQGMILLALGNAVLDDVVVRQFSNDRRIERIEYLLAESPPGARAVDKDMHRTGTLSSDWQQTANTVSSWPVEPTDHQLTVLSNGRMTSTITSSAGGALRWEEIALTRDRVSTDGPSSGVSILLRDLDRKQVWQFGVSCDSAHRHITFAPHFAEFREHYNDLIVRMRVGVAHDADVELRNFSLTNDTDTKRQIAVCYGAEVCLLEAKAFERHPAFQKMFIRAAVGAAPNMQLFQRRAAAAEEHPIFLGQLVCAESGVKFEYHAHYDWARFRGRLKPIEQAPGLIDWSSTESIENSGSLDPMMGATVVLTIPPRQTVQCAFVTAVAADEEQLLEQLSHYRSTERMRWALAQAEVHLAHMLEDIRATSEDFRLAMDLYAECCWPGLRRTKAISAKEKLADGIQSSLWRFGISGDFPIAGVTVKTEADIAPVANLLRRINCMRYCGLDFDLLILDESRSGYAQPVRHQLDRIIDEARALGVTNKAGNIFVIATRDIRAADLENLRRACAPLRDDRDWLSAVPDSQLPFSEDLPFVPLPSSPVIAHETLPLPPLELLQQMSPYGGFCDGGREYVMHLVAGQAPPRPWSNVLANPNFGAVVTDSGGSFTWWNNSNEYRLTPWYNDPVSDRSGEALYLRDEETGHVWSPTPAPAPDGLDYRVRHGAGYTRFEHASQGLSQRLTVFVDSTDAVKFIELELTNQWQRQRRVTATLATEWVLGNSREHGGRHVVPVVIENNCGFLLRNTYARNEGDKHAFVGASRPFHGFSTQREEFFGARNSWENPRGLNTVGLSHRVEASSGGFTAGMLHLDIAPGETVRCHFVLGAAETRDAAVSQLRRFSDSNIVAERFSLLCAQWNGILDQCQIRTPSPAIDTMINRWSMYQALSSRLWGRAGFYQTGGGYGFRDQLQDSLAMLNVKPELVRRQIILAAERQFREGDVLHWWHEDPLRGVRTRCSDDLLWLPYVVVEYIRTTEDSDILDERIRFLDGDPLGPDEHERYAEFDVSDVDATLYDHCCRAIDARTVTGKHGLPFIGTGDWNDGLSRVGIGGEGESVWLAWFLIRVCRDFSQLCAERDDSGRHDYYRDYASQLLEAIAKSAWDGDWYRRGYYDDGTPLGSATSNECQIDLNAQSWSILATGCADERAARAMASARERLEDDKQKLVKLLSPPFALTPKDPGYIKAYPPGVRENGGQYSHAAVWAAWAVAEAGDPDLALKWAEWINPISRVNGVADVERYGCEPYAIAADIYSGEGYTGRGGWSWYTGTAGWWHRLVIEQLLGLRRRGERLYITPKLPMSWPHCEVDFRVSGRVLNIVIDAPASGESGAATVHVNGRILTDDYVLLSAASSGASEIS